MKKTLLLHAIMLVLTGTAFAEGTSMIEPAAVQHAPAQANIAFTNRYPSATHVHWSPEGNEFEAKFQSANQTHKAFYDKDGHWLRTETKIHWTKNLPAAVRTGFRNSSYAVCDVDAIKEVQTSAEHYVAIDVSMVTDYRVGGLLKDVYRLYFNIDGTFLRSEKIS
jgi:hypothetical protein